MPASSDPPPALPLEQPTLLSSLSPRRLLSSTQVGPTSISPAPPPVCSLPRQPFPNHPIWKVTTHTFPAAFPRTLPTSTRPPAQPTEAEPVPLPGDDKTASDKIRKEWAKRVLEDMEKSLVDERWKEMEEKTARWEQAKAEQPQLHCFVNRYARSLSLNGGGNGTAQGQNGLILVLAHANGFHKELWEVCLDNLLSTIKTPIAEIWSLDAVHSGDSGPLNREKLGDTFYWQDNARDVLQFLTHYLPLTPADSPSRSSALRRHGAAQTARNNVVGIGHSFGGCSMAMAANARPDLFSSLLLVDPMIVSPEFAAVPSQGWPSNLMKGAITRRDKWKSRAEAYTSFAAKPFFASWDPRILKLHIRFGLVPVDEHSPDDYDAGDLDGAIEDPEKRGAESGEVTLKCSKLDEARTFAESRRSSTYGWLCLNTGRLSMPVHFAIATDGSVFAGDEEDAQTVAGALARATVDMIPSGHLIPQEQPLLLARSLSAALDRQFRFSAPVGPPPPTATSLKAAL